MRCALLAAILGGCHLAFPLAATPSDGGPNDTNDTNDATDAAPGRCFGSSMSFVKVCIHGEPTNTLDLPALIDTDDACDDSVREGTNPAPDQVCVLVGRSIITSVNVRVTGKRPLVLLGTVSISISKLVDAGGHNASPDDVAGPAARDCSPSVEATADARVGGGGAGGTYGSRGGDGAPSSEASGGTAADPSSEKSLLGGCDGGHGASPDPGDGGIGGGGGGAIALVAGAQLGIVSGGTINASGAGGFSAKQAGGGGGGGSGGTILLDAPQVSIFGHVFANGGGGSESGVLASATPSNRGGESAAPDQAAPGGSQTTGAGGGAGAYESIPAEAGKTNMTSHGGGGGGGGVGVIWIYPAAAVGGVGKISPDPRQ